MMQEAAPPPGLQAKRPQPGRGRAIALAIAVHAAFLALIVFGVRWQSMPTAPVAADLWSKLPAVKPAAPAPAAPVAKPQPQPAPPPKPQPTPPQPPPPKPQAAKPPQPDPAIAEKAKREQQAKEERERLEQQREEQARKKREQEAAAKKKHDQEEAARKKREQAEAARKQKEEEQRRQAEARAKAEAEQAAATARQMEMEKWVDKIRTKILSRANVPDTVATGTEVTVRIRILPGGDVLDIAVTRSTSPTYSAAIERAIRSAQPLPVPDANSELFPQFRDLNLNFRHER